MMTKIDLPFGANHSCPKCKREANDPPKMFYKRRGKQYPVILNQTKGDSCEGSYHDWDEIHFCDKCEEEFYIQNGAF